MLELLAGAAIRSLFLAAAVGTGLRLRRTSNPKVSLAAWTLVLAASLAMPLEMRLTPIAIPHVVIPVAVPPSIIPVARLSFPPALLDPTSAPAAAHMNWRELASYLYLAVFSALMLRLLAGLSLSWRIARAATPVREDWAGALDIRASRRIEFPATFGSIILLPGDHTAWTPARRLAVLAHEGAHVAPHDFAIQLAACFNRAVFWFTPFAWWLRRHLSNLAEAASDDAAIARLNDRFGYAEILLEVSGRVSRLPSAISMARRAGVAGRIERILAGTPLPADMNWRDRAMLAACVGPLAVLLPFLIILPAPPAPRPLMAEVPAAVEAAAVAIVTIERTEEGVTRPAPSPSPAIASAAPISPAAVLPAFVQTDATVAAMPPSSLLPRATPLRPAVVASPPSRTSVAALEAPRRVPHPASKSTLFAGLPHTVRQTNQTTSNRMMPVQTPDSNGPHSSTAPPDEDGQSLLFKTVVDETCAGTYGRSRGGVSPVQARFWRGPDDAPWVTFAFAARKPADLPVTIRGSEIKFTSSQGTNYTLLPSPNMMLPPRYHRLTGFADDSPGGTVEVACGKSRHTL